MKTKTLTYLFFFLTILNLPVFAFYYSGNQSLADGQQFQDYFGILSLGNIGQDQNACGEANNALEKNLTLSCSYGNIQELVDFGLALDNNA